MALLDDIQALLSDYGLAQADRVEWRLGLKSESELGTFLLQYRKFFLNHEGDVLLGPSVEGLSVWPDHISTRAWIGKARAWALWVDRLYLPDPVLEVGDPSQPVLGPRALKEELTVALGTLHDLLPLARVGYVSLTGVPLLRQPHLPLSVTFDPADDQFDPVMRQVALTRLRIGKTPEELRAIADGVFASDMIALAFAEDGDAGAELYLYAPIVGVDASGTVKAKINMQPGPLPTDKFEPWLNQTITKVLRRRFRSLLEEVIWSHALDAQLVTPSATNAELLTGKVLGGEAPTLRRLEDLELPALLNVPAQTLADARNNMESVLRFRQALRQLLALVGAEPGSEQYNYEVREARRVLQEEMLPAMREELQATRITALRNAALTVIGGGIGGILGGWSGAAIGALGAIVPSVAGVIDQARAARTHPLAIYQQVSQAIPLPGERP